MILEHVAIWTDHLEGLKENFESYFLSFKSGARLEIMKRPDIPDNRNDTIHSQHKGIIHLAFGVDSTAEVDEKAKQLLYDGYPILSGPRRTGDGYYEFETLDPDNNRLEVTTVY